MALFAAEAFFGGRPRLLGVAPSCREAAEADLLTALLLVVLLLAFEDLRRRLEDWRPLRRGLGGVGGLLSIGGRADEGSQVGHSQLPSGIPSRPTQ